MTRWFSGVCLALLVCLLAGFGMAMPAAAEEYIRSFHSDIQIAEDGDLKVTETIVVNAEGREIKHGIFRDFPLTMVDAGGNTVRVGFDLLSLTRDGRPETYHTEGIVGGLRIFAGSQDVFLDSGEHTYVLTYRTDRQIRFFPDHDELYWNATGNFWKFRIARASARVTLPGAAGISQTAVYTGPAGSTARDARMQINGNQAVFETTRPLGVEEGLTIVAGFPKAIVDAPSSKQRRAWWWRDNSGTIIAVVGFVLVVAYYVLFWIRVGRDPARGVVVPRWDLPGNLSPALVNYIDNKGFSGGGWTAFAATAINLAVKGQVVLDDLKEKIVIRPVDNPTRTKLEAGERALMASVGRSAPLVIDKENGTRVQTVGAEFRKSIETEHRGRYYQRNRGYVVVGFLLSLLAIVTLIALGNLDADMLAALIVPTIFAVVFGFFAVAIGQGVHRGGSLMSKIIAVVVLGFVGLVAISICSAILVAMMSTLTASDHWPVLVAVGGIVLANAMFFFLMGAPTPLGRKLMDEIEGLRIYLTLAEKDRLNMAGIPTMSPTHFERLLPYAVALGVEKPWSRTFKAWLATAAAGAAAYAPTWYSGDSYNNFGDRIGGFSSSMASTIASTLPSTSSSSSSSSGFSGGSSGGGGGGGGGGGW